MRFRLPGWDHFTGKKRDTETQNDYFGARYYASAMGRFTSPDWDDEPSAVPFADFTNPQTLNLYSYSSNNPLTNMDPDGHDCVNASNAANGSILVQSTNDSSACLSGFTYVNGTVDPSSVTYNGETGDVNFNISNYADGSGISGAVDIGAPASFNDSLMYNTFGPPSASTWNNASGAVKAMGEALLTGASVVAPELLLEDTGLLSLGLEAQAPDVVFGTDAESAVHAMRHVIDEGLNPEDVQGAIKSDIGNGGNLQSGSNTRYIEVDGKTLRYNAYKLPDGTINVGKIVVER